MNVVIHGIGWGILAAAMMLSMKAVARKRGAQKLADCGNVSDSCGSVCFGRL